MKMSLRDWLKQGWLNEHKTRRQEIAELFAAADGDLRAWGRVLRIQGGNVFACQNSRENHQVPKYTGLEEGFGPYLRQDSFRLPSEVTVDRLHLLEGRPLLASDECVTGQSCSVSLMLTSSKSNPGLEPTTAPRSRRG